MTADLLRDEDDFRKASKQLVEALAAAYHYDNHEKTPQKQLVDWNWQAHSEHESFQLVHPPVLTTPLEASLEEEEEEEEWVEESVLLEDPAVMTSHEDMSTSWSWHWSIVYSETYRVPVLYFRVHETRSGAMVTQTRVYTEWQRMSKNSTDEGVENVVSFDEHPVDGLPALFFHPCQTGDRMALLTGTSTTTEAATVPTPASLQLWQWMALLFSSVGWPLSAATFLHVQRVLQQQSSSQQQAESS